MMKWTLKTINLWQFITSGQVSVPGTLEKDFTLPGTDTCPKPVEPL